METPLGGNTGCRQEHQTADGGQQHLGDKRSHCDSNKRPQDFWKTWKDLRDCLLVSNCQIFWRSDQKRDWRGDSHTLTTSSGGSLKFKWLREVCMCTVIRTAAVCVRTGRGLQSHGTLLSHMFEIVAQQQRDKSEAIYGELHNLWSQCWVKVFPQKKKRPCVPLGVQRILWNVFFLYWSVCAAMCWVSDIEFLMGESILSSGYRNNCLFWVIDIGLAKAPLCVIANLCLTWMWFWG